MRLPLAVLPLMLITGCHSVEAAPDEVPVDIMPGIERVQPAPRGEITELRVGQVLEIALHANASTGYRWEVTSAGAPQLARVQLPKLPVEVANNERPMPGSGSIARWHYRAERPGAATLTLVYRRSWEKDVPPVETVEYKVEVR